MDYTDIAYSVVAGPNGPLAEHAAIQGNFGLFAQQILDQLTGLPIETEGKRSFPYQGYTNMPGNVSLHQQFSVSHYGISGNDLHLCGHR